MFESSIVNGSVIVYNDWSGDRRGVGEMEPEGNAQLPIEASEVDNVKTVLEKIRKQARDAVWFIMVIAGFHVLFGAALTLFPRLLGGFLAPSASFETLLFGLAYLGLSVGLHRRSRVCAILVAVAAFANSVSWQMSGLFARMNMGAYVVQGVLIGGDHKRSWCLFQISCTGEKARSNDQQRNRRVDTGEQAEEAIMADRCLCSHRLHWPGCLGIWYCYRYIRIRAQF